VCVCVCVCARARGYRYGLLGDAATPPSFSLGHSLERLRQATNFQMSWSYYTYHIDSLSSEAFGAFARETTAGLNFSKVSVFREFI
jgi:hypothetical protein